MLYWRFHSPLLLLVRTLVGSTYSLVPPVCGEPSSLLFLSTVCFSSPFPLYSYILFFMFIYFLYLFISFSFLSFFLSYYFIYIYIYVFFLCLHLVVASLSLSVLPDSSLASLHFPHPPTSHTTSTVLAGTTLIENQLLPIPFPVQIVYQSVTSFLSGFLDPSRYDW